uniref:Chalcone isomerase domain-containing protein n=1 Tax=Chromera velia CCMP2878 TaxID=1169474 RepID=A0A0G4GWT2_9ALVE|mmetsp:Transcript_33789/g.66898  ORF Transcript_33789/g.66898 Transcript_33789/m.66898 type:complete len:229 (-) Transcript_33789:557-1243(-)|eukprot:Cvel_5325.t1-p1 / transcript=Cvel_5325.t1 / gene=Cvel_5325 / organism=Chromera_velia_CCMP2878 / gene_product=Fatty-acid-binding protein 1, putative / transcript_product=Fatty-acid-binding protein 1, putative / location=Cvel_scaffold247:5786-6469(+) / protein_length=228 / sequence_SO=supercontig / SO=protein_coding / is_pseudo=false
MRALFCLAGALLCTLSRAAQLNRRTRLAGFPLAAILTDAATGLDFETDVSFPSSPKMTLLGAGVRAKALLGPIAVNVYSVGLYVEPSKARQTLSGFKTIEEAELAKKEDFYKALMKEDLPKAMHLKFARSVGASKIVEALTSLNGVPEESLSKFSKLLLDSIGSSIGYKETVTLSSSKPDTLDVIVRGKHAGSVRDSKLPKAFFDLYLGKNPVSSEAKKAFASRVKDL